MNLRGIWAVFRKEFRENLRDRRTLLSALVFGPVLGPVLVAGIVQFQISHAEEQSDENISAAVMHAERAPNLLAYLTARGVDIQKVDFDDAGARHAVATQTHKIILDIPEDFGQRLQEGQPAPVILYSDGSRQFELRGVGRVRALISQYSLEIAQLRYLARGIDPISILPISVQEIDVSTPSSRSVLVMNMMTYLVLLSMLFGGLYLAIDATAGERERGSLEVLLTSPVPREHLIYGKIFAAAAYMLISLVLTVTMFAVAMSFVGFEQLGFTANLGPARSFQAHCLLRAADPVRCRLSEHRLRLRQELPRSADLPGPGDHHPDHAADVRRHAGTAGETSAHVRAVPVAASADDHGGARRAHRTDVSGRLGREHLLYGVLLMWLAGRLYRREGLLG